MNRDGPCYRSKLTVEVRIALQSTHNMSTVEHR